LTPLPMLSKQIVVLAWTAKDVFTFSLRRFHSLRTSCWSVQWRSQPKICLGVKYLGRPKCVISGEQQYIVLDTASPSTKSLDKLKIWGELLATLMDQCSQVGVKKNRWGRPSIL